MAAPVAYESDIPSSFDRGINFTEPFDEDAVYAEDINFEDPAEDKHTHHVDLYQEPTRGGAVRTTFQGSADGMYVHAMDKSNYHILVQRLVWVDGWCKTTGSGPGMKQEDDMTLVVLKFSFHTISPDSRIGFALAELSFHSDDKDVGDDPEVVAWGPFGHREVWNTARAQVRRSVKNELRTAVGWAGQAVSGSVAGERETSWDKVNFDQGNSHELYSEKGGKKPHGVRWILKQNRLSGQGITPEMRIAALVRRPRGAEPYRVMLRLEAHSGIREQWFSGAQKFLGQKPGDKIVWRAKPRPGEKDNCHADGEYIVRSVGGVDVNNLGALITDPSDSQTLNPVWLNPRGFFEEPRPAATAAVDAGAEGDGMAVAAADAAAEVEVHMQPHNVTAADPPAREADPPRGTLPPVGGAHPAVTVKPPAAPAGGAWSAGGGTRDPAPPIGEPGLFTPGGAQYSSYSRLVALEARAAQAEARLAAQEQLVFKLQQALARLDPDASVRGGWC